MRIVFMGTPVFAVQAVQALQADGHDIVAVYSRAPKAAGRGKKITLSPVHAWAEDNSITVETPKTLRDEEAQATLAGYNADVIVVAAYGLILPQAVLDMPKHGCLNIHASMLPRWRGAAPIQRAILAGDANTGVCIMQMDAGLDSGPVLLSKIVSIESHTAGTLHDALADIGADLIVETLKNLDTLTVLPQQQKGITYADKITKQEAQINWLKTAQQIERQVRAFNPFPGAFFECTEGRIKVLECTIIDPQDKPDDDGVREGDVCNDALTVVCGKNTFLQITKLQKQGKAATDAASFLRGNPIPVGTHLAV